MDSEDADPVGTTAPSQPGDGIDTRRVAAELRARMFGIAADPPRIGRHLVVDRIGAGAMGVVYRAYDAELDRRIAIKLVLDDTLGEAHERLAREAQAIARISHPNVVAVFDVGTHDGQVYVAMEYVEGQTLRSWMTEPRAWREVVDVFAAAGRGLAAAHDGGVIHRDFKPDNVLLGRRGEVKVVDFGLALAGGTTTDRHGVTLEDGNEPDAVVPSTLAGTPAYMSPEQFVRGPLDARSDQFSFCCALYEALWGDRPFAGESFLQLCVAVQSGQVRGRPPGRDVPRWLDAVVVRGLAKEQDARWPSMSALVEALVREPGRRLRARLVAGSALVGAALVGGLAMRSVAHRETPCADADLRLRELWTPARAQQLDDTLVALDTPYAETTAANVTTGLDAWATEWSAMARDNCEATAVRAEQSTDLLDMRTACLRDRAANFAALVEVLETGGVAALERAPRAVGELPPVASCGDGEGLRSRFPPPSDPDAVERTRDEIALVRARLGAMPDEAARTDAGAVIDRARAVEYPPVLLEALLLGARHDSDPERARSRFDEAFWIAAQLHDDVGQFEGAVGLAHNEGALLERVDVGLTWARHARAAAERAGLPLRKRARIEAQVGSMRLRGGHYAEAVAHYATAVALVETDPEAEPLLMSAALVNLASSYNQLGDQTRARPLLERALAIEESVLGPYHPELAATLIDLGNVLQGLGEVAQSRPRYERAIELLERTKPDAPELGMALANLASAASTLGDDQEALRRQQQALALFERTLGPTHLYVASTLGNLARHQPEAEALVSLERAIAIYDAHDPEHPGIAYPLNQIADIHNVAHRPELALPAAERALAVREKKLGATHPDVAWSLHVLGDTLRLVGRAREGVPLLERALAIRVAMPGAEVLAARTRFVLGCALWEIGQRPRARELVDEAAKVLPDGPSASDRIFAQRLREWRGAHR